MKTTKLLASIVVIVVVLALSSASNAGSLEPSAPPGPTMKTLDEVEPRIPIPASDTPTGTFTISESGSYYLTGERNASGTGITVEANDVTIDLMGYSIIGPGTGAGSYSGIIMSARSNVEIRNGTVRNFGYPGISGNNGKNHRIIGVRAVSNGSGIELSGNSHLVKDCTAANNTTGAGIGAGYGSTITGNTAYNNQWAGVSVGGHGSAVTGNTVYNNQSYGSTFTGNTVYNNQNTGISASGYGSTVTGNTVYNNQWYGIYTSGYGCTVTGNTAYNNWSNGIYAGYGCTVTGNTARSNNQGSDAGSAGIRVGSGCLVKGNTLQGNLRNNIYVASPDNAIEENLVTSCSGNGIYFNATGNFYANNRASGNTINYGGALPAGGGDGGGNAEF